jgi:hypothetical protein
LRCTKETDHQLTLLPPPTHFCLSFRWRCAGCCLRPARARCACPCAL